MSVIGFDVGGTFTDIFVVDGETGTTHREKVSTTPEDPSTAILRGIRTALSEQGIDPADVTRLSHGSTIATNAMLEREGATTGLITTRGFRDLLAIGRERRTELYNSSPSKPPAFVKRRHRVGVAERLDADGGVVEPLDEGEVIEAVERFERTGVESIAVSFLHAYRNPVHERRVAEIVAERSDLPVSLSSDVMAEIQEYERTLSTAIDAYVHPLVEDYVERLVDGLEDLGTNAPLHLMQANGGVMTPDTIDGRSLQLINSGPAGGVIGARQFAAAAGIDDLITLDMGGTSADACVVKDGEIETTTEGEIGDVPLSFPQIDVRTVGAGGGSIAWLDRADVLNVGPKSSGARPGPACYDRGGSEPTVTDAAVYLGYLNPDYFLGGEMTLDESAAEDVIEALADELGEDPLDIADGILDIATTNMTHAIELVTVEKGYDPRDFALVPYGGAGPMFATRLARRLDVDTAFVPTAPGVLSATGMLAADKRFSFSRSRKLLVEAGNLDEIRDLYETLRDRAESVLDDDYRTAKTVDVRYAGQTFKLSVDFPAETIDEEALEGLRRRFDRQYESIYGYAPEDTAVEAVTWRLEAIAETMDIDPTPSATGSTVHEARKGKRKAYADGAFREYAIFDRYALPPGSAVEGPAIVEEAEATTVAGADTTVRVDGDGNLIIEVGSDG